MTEPDGKRPQETDCAGVSPSSVPSGVARVLIVDDNDADAELFARMLRKGDASGAFACSRASDSVSALLQISALEPHAILLDLGLPDASGLSALREILAARPQMPVVVITGCDQRGIGLDAVRAGAQDYLLKEDAARAPILKSIRYAIERARATAVRR